MKFYLRPQQHEFLEPQYRPDDFGLRRGDFRRGHLPAEQLNFVFYFIPEGCTTVSIMEIVEKNYFTHHDLCTSTGK